MDNENRKKAAGILSIISVVCLLIIGILLLRSRIQDRHSQETVDGLREQASVSSEAVPTPTPAPVTPTPTATPTPEVPSPDPTPVPTPEAVVNPYRDAFLANEDMGAWLQIPGTDIDYPVMWTPRDEEYYLHRDFDGSANDNGCLILDTDSCLDPLTTNLIIHGHNMRSGAMFGTLTDYEKESFCQEHKDIILYTEECQRNYEVIAVFRSQVFRKSDKVFKFYQFFQADTQEEFDDFYDNIKEMSLYDTGVTAEFGDHFITLSTCVYHVENGRFVVVAKEVDSGDVYLPLNE
ncbi:MAG: class B sortase [Lachnospiraceae bacterium]|nr:class B sortase [Butyrivibrio sp.]MCM1344444.1 class B sortase [Muribaculaceae bacterium]MCM1411144.1 class B sortase [Lachnospiraceae bacterium]